MGATVGYVRVSSTGQNLSAQRTAVKAAGAEKVFADKKSGASIERPQLKACLEYIREGDTLVVTKADRIARSSRDLLGLLHDLSKRGVALKFTDQPELNSRDKYAKLMLTILAAVAELERELIRERQAAGIEDAKRRGVKFGRKPKVTQETSEIVKRLRDEGMSVPSIAAYVGMKRSSVYNALKFAKA